MCSRELCGGTHVGRTGEIGFFKIVSEGSAAAGVRRIEAVTGPGAYTLLRGHESTIARLAEVLKTPVDGVERRVQALLDERRTLERRLEEAMRGGGGQLEQLLSGAQVVDGVRVVAASVTAADVKELQALGDALRERIGSGIAVIAATVGEGKHTMLAVVTDDLRERGLRADSLVRDVAAIAGGRGGGKPHMAQAGIPDAARIPAALAEVPAIVARQVG